MISVIIPSYNRAETITNAAASVLSQSYRDIELIIVDDCSNDNTREVVAGIADRDNRVRYLRHERNKGACAARNTGIDAAKGEFIAFQDSDDIWYPEKLDKQMYAFQQKDADIAFCKYKRIVDGQVTEIGPIQYNEGFQDPIVSVFGIGTQTLIAKRKVFEEFRFDTELPRFQDLELLIRITEKYKLYCVDLPLVEYNAGSMDSISQKPEKLFKASQIILGNHPDVSERLPETGRVIARMLLKDVSYADKETGISKSDIYKVAFAFDKSWKCRVRILLRIFKLYDLVLKDKDK